METINRVRPRNLLYLAVVPVYRNACIRLLLEKQRNEIAILAGDRHLDPTVTTGIGEDLVSRVKNIALFRRRILLQVGGWNNAVRAEVCVVDLNPRSITAWMICGIRRMLRRRTLVWGHLHPRAGANSRTAPLRVMLRKLSNGTILYGYDSVVPAKEELPAQLVWVAPNSLYPSTEIGFDRNSERRAILYVGRLEPAKRVDLLVDSFSESGLHKDGYVLDIVGSGSQLDFLRTRATELGIANSVHFHGRIDDVGLLRQIYRRACFSVSPGYVGLSITQSLGFGVPFLYAADAPHAPEIELTRFGGTRSYAPSEVGGLSDAMQTWTKELNVQPVNGEKLSGRVRQYYSAEAMAEGIRTALEGEPAVLGEDGWPLPIQSNDGLAK